ncbi:Ferredoxin subunit of nitrite reductase or a ring-hydroxylating dioxygenase [Streptoalloteichus tenebrarius]|uniref:Cytochrome bc1 complex Rieske iron-sulfur subunit n=1 Tax=Streptoalloteichus tenebrarius (strain ATCC 17920 / DSM 40477 / JCM 4838 / CBS 697.72 / NBRC 16177 / NCIMB 11028 / NRRL B-12390 / A12253. 1 / ISP 5477) TaxID=1933 RepID=A0ABT1HSZ4_STRSD|nr:Rieske (2Fe-2S) protein [Streptoalloteichus tenebrarius]MCP2258608.1 Ferredoxin subunit of nitrite reductase or a ring-hydroxylating dioxygenase [Streptoalloteichus tenebrarius]BFF04019.1 Rieske (2Fe-2S) protein [Streptoalloteichus tenebrarius]
MDDAVRSRRSVLCGLAVALLAPGALAACGSPQPARKGGVGDAKPGTRVAAVADVPVGGGRLVDVPGGGRLLLVRPTEAEVRAFDPTCPHLGTLVSEPAKGVVTCPTHGSEFDAASGALRRGPAPQGLTAVPVAVRDDQVVLA